MIKYFYLLSDSLRRFCSEFIQYSSYVIHPTRLKPDLALRHAVLEAQRMFRENGVRYFVVPTPEGKLRIISAAEAQSMIRHGFFPRKWKIQNIYSIAFYWTDATKSPKHGNSLGSYANLNAYRDWWRTTH